MTQIEAVSGAVETLQAKHDQLEEESRQQLYDLQDTFGTLLLALHQSEKLTVSIRSSEGQLVIEECSSTRLEVGDGVMVLGKHSHQWLGTFRVIEILGDTAYCQYGLIFSQSWWNAACETAATNMRPQMNVLAVIIPQRMAGGFADGY